MNFVVVEIHGNTLQKVKIFGLGGKGFKLIN